MDHHLLIGALGAVIEPPVGGKFRLAGYEVGAAVRQDRYPADGGHRLMAEDLEGRGRLEDSGVSE